jgi:hypothetical protein
MKPPPSRPPCAHTPGHQSAYARTCESGRTRHHDDHTSQTHTRSLRSAERVNWYPPYKQVQPPKSAECRTPPENNPYITPIDEAIHAMCQPQQASTAALSLDRRLLPNYIRDTGIAVFATHAQAMASQDQINEDIDYLHALAAYAKPLASKTRGDDYTEVSGRGHGLLMRSCR